MTKPLISVVLPVFNIEDYLQKCMDSLYVQTYRNLEFLVVDDGSDYKCASLCDAIEKQDARVRVFHKANGGLSDARNYGIARANGEYIACVDPDDYIDDDYFEYLFNLIKKHNTKMSVCQHRVIFSKRVVDYGQKDAKSETIEAKTCIERMLYHDVIDTSAWAKLYHRSLFDSIDYPKGKNYEDIATTYKLFIESKKVAVGYQSKYNYIVRKDSIVNSSFSPKKLELIEMTDSMAKDVLLKYPDLEEAVIRRQVYSRFSTLNQMIGANGVEEIRKSIILFIKKNGERVKRNPNARRRDVFAINILSLGYRAYALLWLIYRMSGR